MVSTQRPSRAEQVASNARGWTDGGCIFADAPNAVTLAAVILHPISTHRNIAPLRVTRLSQVSSQASGGFTTIVRRNSSPARSFPLLTRVRRINRCPDQPDGCLQTGKRCFTDRVRAPRDLPHHSIALRGRRERHDFAMISPQCTNSTIAVNVRFSCVFGPGPDWVGVAPRFGSGVSADYRPQTFDRQTLDRWPLP
jgi:hypothetical protein